MTTRKPPRNDVKNTTRAEEDRAALVVSVVPPQPDQDRAEADGTYRLNSPDLVNGKDKVFPRKMGHPGKSAANGTTTASIQTVATPTSNAEIVPERHRGRTIITLVLILAASVLAGFASLPWWREYVFESYRTLLPTGPVEESSMTDLSQTAATLRYDLDHLAGQINDRVNRLESSLTVLEQRLTAMENSSSLPLAGSEVPLEALTYQITTLEARLGNLGDRFDATAAREQVGVATIAAVYDDRLAALEKAVRLATARQDNALTWLLAVAQLREAVHRGVPFATELHAARALAEKAEVVDTAVTSFVAHAVTGLPTRTTLEARFDSLNSEIARAAIASKGDGWLKHVLQRLLAVITIRRTDRTATGEGTLAVMARASASLQSGELANAVRAMEALQGEPALVAEAWMTFARARAAADEALSSLTARALERTAANHIKAGG